MDQEEFGISAHDEPQTAVPFDDEQIPPAGGDRPVRVLPPMRRLDWLVLAVIVCAYGIALFARIGAPGAVLADDDEQCTKWPVMPGATCYAMIPLDEWHYIPDARDVLRFGTESDTRVPTDDDGAYVVHPPVGKMLIAAGIAIFGDRPLGWRAFGCVFAILGVLALYALARRLWGSPWWAALAASLLALDGLWFVQARVAMLDIYAGVFTLIGIWLVVEARDRRSLRWYVLAGVALGLAMATKWGPAPIVFVALVLAVRWGGWRALATAAVIPVIYVAAFTPWFLDEHRYVPPKCEGEHIGGRFGAWACYQNEVYHFHRDLKKYEPADDDDASAPASATSTTPSTPRSTGSAAERLKPGHPYFGHGYSWPWLGRPVAHHYEGTDGSAEEVLGLPNPLTWWTGFFIALPLLIVFTIRRRDAVAPVLLALFAAGYLPYALADIVERPVFLFYAVPLVPILVLSVVHVLQRGAQRFEQVGTLAVAFVMVAAGTAIYFYPVLAAQRIPLDGTFGWRRHMWLTADCTVEDQIKRWCWI